MHQMNQMMSSFFGGFSDPMAGMMGVGGGGGMFGPMMGSMMGSIMDNHMGMMANPQGQSFSSSTYMSYSSHGPNGQPQVFKLINFKIEDNKLICIIIGVQSFNIYTHWPRRNKRNKKSC